MYRNLLKTFSTDIVIQMKRSELIAIDEALRIIKTMTSPDEIWILCDSRSAIQHLSDWTNVGDKNRSQFLKILKNFPSNMGIIGRPQVVPFPSRRIESSKQLLVGLQVDPLEAFPLT
ncbi:hypothetical protein TNCV_4767271 [Trichonephila clavipes]|nr:hypothetical protein TNCV_4767271 [Trichonephila clavipes]